MTRRQIISLPNEITERIQIVSYIIKLLVSSLWINFTVTCNKKIEGKTMPENNKFFVLKKIKQIYKVHKFKYYFTLE